ncbi:MAG: DUF5667 domain-containing protein [Candidatus Gracilibacteria bacterium]|jgi:hypothetical protein
MQEPDILAAKKRIWNRLESRLPNRGMSIFEKEVSILRSAAKNIQIERLKRVQLKERLVDILPERTPAFTPTFTPVFGSFFSKKIFATVSLFALFATFILPVFRTANRAEAAPENTMQIVEGDVTVNGVPINKTIEGNTVILQEGDTIITGSSALAHITFVDDTRLSLGPDTEIKILESQVSQKNSTESHVAVFEQKGRVFAQVVNLVSDEAYFTLYFNDGDISVNQRASFDAQVGDNGTKVIVARNLVNATVNKTANSKELAYKGMIGQGAKMIIEDGVVTTSGADKDVVDDVWWSFNLAYSTAYIRELDESYKQENIKRALILPGNPLYFLKTFRENVQTALAFTASAKTEIMVEQAQNRLDEAQTLIAQNKPELARQTLDAYQETISAVTEQAEQNDLMGDTKLSETLAAITNEANKEVLVSAQGSETISLLGDGLSPSQKLQLVPDLIAAGNLEDANRLLSNYQTESLSLLVELENVPMEQRETAASNLLDQKLNDIQLLRVIASLPEMQNETSMQVNLGDAVLSQLSLMVLSLRERELNNLATALDTSTAEDLYTRLKENTEITPALSEQLNAVEEQISAPQNEAIVDVQAVDPRFTD